MIRSAQPEDGAALAGIYNPYVLDTTVTFEDAAVSPAAMAERVRAVLAAHPWLVWEEDGTILGYAYAHPWRERHAYRFSVETSVYVAQSARRRGIGSGLYRELLPDLRRRGCHTALAGITLPNEASVALHERFGFHPVARLPEVGRKFDQWLDVGYWARVL